MSFELELLCLGRGGNAIVVCGEQSPLDMSFAKLRAQQIFDGARKNGGPVDAIRIRNASGEVAFIYRDEGGRDLPARPHDPTRLRG
jgi:hypothetical protein